MRRGEERDDGEQYEKEKMKMSVEDRQRNMEGGNVLKMNGSQEETCKEMG